MNFLYISFLLVMISFRLESQPVAVNPDMGDNKSFEGLIYFSEEMLSDTFYFTYYVKDRMVRLDEYSRCKTCKAANNYLLFDLDKKNVIAVNPLRKMYLRLPIKPAQNTGNDESDFQILKTNNCKKIYGYKCYQWRVKNKKQNTEVSYWVAKDKFDFFVDLLNLWNRSEKHAAYYLKIPDTKDYFPLLSEERTTLREQKMTLRVITLQKKVLDKNLFNIPKDYKSYEE
jgi:hypothetical protein